MSDNRAVALPDARTLSRATRGAYLVFIGAGLGFATWAARIPQARAELGLTPGELGMVLLAIALGALLAMPAAGLIVHRLGAARTIVVMSLLTSAGLAIAGVGVLVGVVPVVIGLALMGFGSGAWDVAMNVEAAAVEQQLQRSIMARFHAGFSVGTVIGALIGAGMNALGVSVTVNLLAVAAFLAIAMPLSTRSFLPAGTGDHTEVGVARHPLKAWTEPRTLLIGLFVLTMAFSEGTATDWLGVAAIDGYGATAALGSLAYGVFVTSMTVGRWYGPQVLDRFGRVPVLRASAAGALVGLLIVVQGPNLGTAMLGTVLWGLGTALGFPVGMSAAADQRSAAAGRVSVVATIGYVAFLSGPPLIGLLGDRVGVLRALSVTAGLLAVGLLVASSTRRIDED
ncbi:MAG: MFS transporter [Actinomycetota bacterium]|nr:MFS transporter [Actinomycetota bacterium]MDH4016690.1 MFS transporter [Actinomycetota bacterium]